MKTLLVALEFPPAVGGVETYYKNLVEKWPEEISVLDNSTRQLVKPGMKWLPGLFAVMKKIQDMKPDWVIAGEILPIGTILWLLSFILNFKYAVVLHGLDLSLATRNAFKRRLSKAILSRSSRIIAVNSYVAEQVIALLPEGTARLGVVNPGVNIEAASPRLVATLKANYALEGSFIILTMARLVKRKGVDMVLRSFPAVLKEIPASRYVVVGQGPDKDYIQAVIDELGLDPYVVFLPTASPEEKDAWLDACDVFVMPSRNINGDYEGFGIVYLDAGSFGKPVIAGASGGVRDAVQDGFNGLIVNENEPVSIAEAIIKLYRDPELRQRLGENGKGRASELTWLNQVARFHAMLQ